MRFASLRASAWSAALLRLELHVGEARAYKACLEFLDNCMGTDSVIDLDLGRRRIRAFYGLADLRAGSRFRISKYAFFATYGNEQGALFTSGLLSSGLVRGVLWTR